MEVKIHKGQHLSNQLSYPRFNIFDNGQVVAEVTFTPESRYDLEDKNEQLDWNKLFGASWGYFPFIQSYMMHHNSSRFGWRYNLKTNKYEVTPYFYVKGVRSYAETLGIEPAILDEGEKYKFTIKPYSSVVSYLIEDKFGKEVFKYTAIQDIPTTIGWFAPSYFGGSFPAPKDVSYLFKKL
jgi:hypothetical protein